jgi:hypothetical protein
MAPVIALTAIVRTLKTAATKTVVKITVVKVVVNAVTLTTRPL